DQPLCGKIHRPISRIHVDVNRFKVGPHGGRRVREPALCEGVGGEQGAEIVGTEWKGNRKEGKNGKAQQEGAEAYGCNRQQLFSRQASKGTLDARESDVAQTRPCECKSES